eukprot:scaffold106_cov177-Ochromonas_danica.AAC.3
MEQGNEGDEILFFSCRQIGCDLPVNLHRVGDLSADNLIAILSRAIAIITNGDVQLPTTLPANIASRHRICTDVSLQIKALGYPSDCGYNQLLYPVEHQTRDLLKYIVFKVPRGQDDDGTGAGGGDEFIGANALLSRQLHQSLLHWQKAFWVLPCSLHDRPLQNVFQSYPFQSLQRSPLLAAHLLQNHLMQKVREDRQRWQIHSQYLNTNTTTTATTTTTGSSGSSAGAGAAGGGDAKALEQAQSMERRIQQALRDQVAIPTASRSDPTSTTSVVDVEGVPVGTVPIAAAGGGGGGGVVGAMKQLDLSFQELINSIAEAKVTKDSSSGNSGSATVAGGAGGAGVGSSEEEGRLTRFAHATVFAQEIAESTTSALLTPSSSATTTALSPVAGAGGVSGDAAGKEDKKNLTKIYEAAYASAFQQALAQGVAERHKAEGLAREQALVSALSQVREDLLERKKVMAMEEEERLEQLALTRHLIEEYTLQVEAQSRREESLQKLTSLLEEEVVNLQKETDRLEKDCLTKRQALELVPSASENIVRLQESCDKNTEKLRLLEEEWDSVQQPLLEELTRKERKKAARVARVAEMLEEMERYRELMLPMVQDLKEKQQRAELLQEETTKLNKNLQRSVYTHRILDITTSIGIHKVATTFKRFMRLITYYHIRHPLTLTVIATTTYTHTHYTHFVL